MLSLPAQTSIFACTSPVDFRKQHDGLVAIVRDRLDGDPFDGSLFLFFNRRRDRIKLLLWDRNGGFWLFYKRLEAGTFTATYNGTKELIAVDDGVRESEQSWKEVLLGLKARGLDIDPELVVGDGALGFWKALPQVWPDARAQRCWVHKVANVLNKLPKSVQPKALSSTPKLWRTRGDQSLLILAASKPGRRPAMEATMRSAHNDWTQPLQPAYSHASKRREAH